MRFEQEKAEIVRIVKAMYHSGMTNLFEGNVSMLVDGVMLLTPSQQDKERLTPDMILELNLDGQVLYAKENLRPSVEYRMHAALYRMRPDIRSVVHNHSTYATAYAMAGLPVTSDAHLELNLLFGEIPVAPYGMLGTEAIYAGIKPLMREHHVVLLENHGLLAVAGDLLTAFSRAEAAEKMAKTLLMTRLLGGEKPLPPEELAAIRQQSLTNRLREIQQTGI